jgi:hypothetical protein
VSQIQLNPSLNCKTFYVASLIKIEVEIEETKDRFLRTIKVKTLLVLINWFGELRFNGLVVYSKVSKMSRVWPEISY